MTTLTAWLALGSAAAGVAVASGWLGAARRTRTSAVTVVIVLAVLLGGSAVLADAGAVAEGWPRWVAVTTLGAAAVLGGAAATVAVLTIADRDAGVAASPVRFSGLRGGVWIGVLERLGIFGALAAGYPEGVALILAVKGLARYPELRAGQQSGVAERFIIGTFTSMAVAAACAGVLHLLG